MDYNTPPMESMPAVFDLPNLAIASSLLPVRTTHSDRSKGSATSASNNAKLWGDGTVVCSKRPGGILGAQQVGGVMKQIAASGVERVAFLFLHPMGLPTGNCTYPRGNAIGAGHMGGKATE